MFLFGSGCDFLNPLFTLKAANAPYGFYDIVCFEGDVDPEGWPVENKTCENSKGNGKNPQKNIVGKHEHFGVAAAAENALCHNAVCGAEDDYYADGGHELFCNAYGFGAYIVG